MKEKDIFHECVCTGQKMTWEELESELDAYQYVIVIDKEIEETL
jgi:hypothetical protein